jgi:hypothetical protein
VALTFTYEWLRDGTPINGANSPNYIVTDADAGHTLTFKVSGENGYGATVAISLPFVIPSAAPTPPTLPVNTVAPIISSATVGISTIASTGTWTGTAPITYTYQWYLNGAVIVGQTSNAYTPISGDIGKNLYCIVTANNLAGTTSAQSNTEIVASSGSYINVPDAATLSAILAAGPVASGGKSYRLAATNFGSFGFYNFDFSSNPILIAGTLPLGSTSFNYMGFDGTSGFTFDDINVDGDPDYCVGIANTNPNFPSVLTFNRVTCVNSDSMGTQTAGGYNLRNLYKSTIVINGQNDATKPDIWGRSFGIAMTDCCWTSGSITIENITFDNIGINQILGGGAQNISINHCLFQNQFWTVGDHPNCIHFFGSDAVASSNLTITNNFFSQGAHGGGAISVILEFVETAFVQNNASVMGIFFDAYLNNGNNVTFDNNFGQGIASIGGSMLMRSGCSNAVTTNNTVTNASPLTYSPEGPYPGYVTSGNSVTSPPSASAWNDWAAQMAWAATHPSARAHP